jgi:hypothetical protein
MSTELRAHVDYSGLFLLTENDLVSAPFHL